MMPILSSRSDLAALLFLVFAAGLVACGGGAPEGDPAAPVAGSDEHPQAGPINIAMPRNRKSHGSAWPRNQTVVSDVSTRFMVSAPAADGYHSIPRHLPGSKFHGRVSDGNDSG